MLSSDDRLSRGQLSQAFAHTVLLLGLQQSDNIAALTVNPTPGPPIDRFNNMNTNKHR
jgi:hypothetical protein